MSNMKNRLVNTLLGEVDLSKIKNKRLLKVIKQRIGTNHFLFTYGDNTRHSDDHRDNCGYSESRAGIERYLCHDDHNDSHSDTGYSETKTHTDYSDYSDYKEHSEYKESAGHTDYWDRS